MLTLQTAKLLLMKSIMFTLYFEIDLTAQNDFADVYIELNPYIKQEGYHGDSTFRM